MSDSKKLSKERFGQYAEGYVTSKTHASGYDLDRLLELADPQPDWQVLDIATGGGHTALKFAPHVAHVIASDLTPRMLEKAAAHLKEKGVTNATFEVADAENLPFEDGRFDLVTCRIAPHHFPDIARFVRECFRVLKPGGLLLVQDQVLPEDAEAGEHVNAFEKLRDPSHNQVLPESTWREIFTATGFTILHTEQLTKRHTLIPWAKMQNNTDETIIELKRRLREGPSAALAWLDLQQADTPDESFINHHLIIAGRRS